MRSLQRTHHGLGTLWNFVTVVPWRRISITLGCRGQCGVVTARGRAWKLREEECNGNSVMVIYKRLKLSANWPVGLLAQWLRRWPFASTARVRSPAWAERKKIVRSSAANPSRPGDVVEFRYIMMTDSRYAVHHYLVVHMTCWKFDIRTFPVNTWVHINTTYHIISHIWHHCEVDMTSRVDWVVVLNWPRSLSACILLFVLQELLRRLFMGTGIPFPL